MKKTTTIKNATFEVDYEVQCFAGKGGRLQTLTGLVPDDAPLCTCNKYFEKCKCQRGTFTVTIEWTPNP